MAFKLGTARQPYAVNGEIKSKLAFKNSPLNEDGLSVPGNAIIRVPLADDIIAEANGPDHPEHPNSRYLNDRVDPESDLAKQALNHEMIHATAMKISKNKLAYTDDTVTYEGNIYPRKDIDGKDMIQDIETGQWKEVGDHTWPWEKDADILTSDPEIKQ